MAQVRADRPYLITIDLLFDHQSNWCHKAVNAGTLTPVTGIARLWTILRARHTWPYLSNHSYPILRVAA